MGDKAALFCSSCGTVTTVQSGDCPACTKPLKKLGKVGVISESKRSTQQLINFENNKALVGGRKSQLFVDSDDSDSYLPTRSKLYMNTPASKPSSKPSSPKSPRRTLVFPSSSTTSTTDNSPQQYATSPPSSPPSSQSSSPRKDGSEPTAPTTQAPEPPQTPTTEQPPTQRGFFSAALTRMSQAFSWKSKSDQKVEQLEPATPSSPPAPPSLNSSLSAPNLNALANESIWVHSSEKLNGSKVLPSQRFLRRRSSIDFSSRSQSSPYISVDHNNFLKKNETASPEITFRNSPSFSLITHASASKQNGNSTSESHKTTTSETSTAPPADITEEKPQPPATNGVHRPSTPTFTIPIISLSKLSPPSSPIGSPSTSSELASSPSTSSENPSPRSPASPAHPLSPASPVTMKPAKPPKPSKFSKLRVEVQKDKHDKYDRQDGTLSSPDAAAASNFHFFKNKSTLNISVSKLSESTTVIPQIGGTLPTPRSRPLPSPPVIIPPPNPFVLSVSGSPPVSSPRQLHTPPKRPLPSLPTLTKSEPHPSMMRRNTVHSDMHAVKPMESPSRKEIPAEWITFAHSQLNSPPQTRREKPTEGRVSPTGKGEVTLLPHIYVYPHIPVPPTKLASTEMREKIAQELISTEYEYVNDLHTLVLAKTEMERFIHKNELSSIFNNIDQIYKVNEAIYKKMLSFCALAKRRSSTTGETTPSETDELPPSVDDKVAAISRTFLGLSHTLKIYVKGHQRAFDKFKALIDTEEFGTMMKSVEAMPGFRSAEIAGFLIKPVQRICRYPLLLKEILKSTPAGNQTLPELQEALSCVEQTIVEINEAQRAIERELNLMRAQQDLRLFGMDIDVMSPTRTLVVDGPMMLVPVLRKNTASKLSKKPKQGHYFLFDDFFLFVMNTKKKETPHIFIPADQTLVTDPGENALEIIHAGQQIWMFVLPSYHDKVFLLQKLNQIIDDNLQEAKQRNGQDKTSKSALNIATLTRSGKQKVKRKKTSNKKGGSIETFFD